MKKLELFLLLIVFLLMAACGQSTPVEPTPLPPTATLLPSITPTATSIPTQTPIPTLTPTLTPRPTKTPVPQEVLDQLHTIYTIMFAVQIHAELVSEAAKRVSSEELTAEDAFEVIRKQGLSTENLDSAIQYMTSRQITVPETFFEEWETLLQAHNTITDILSRWIDQDVTPDQVMAEMTPVQGTVEDALGSAEGKLGPIIGEEGVSLTVNRRTQLPAVVNRAFPKPVLEACAGEALQEASVSRKGRLAFVSDRDGNAEIYAMNADGTDITRLTDNSAGDYAPAWSPDGNQIAFYSQRDGNAEIYVMDADGSNLTRLTNHPKDDYDPAWSPDGTKIAFHSHRANENPQIFVMNADGSEVSMRDARKMGGWSPQWSPDGTQILFNSAYGPSRDIWLMNADGTHQVNITNIAKDDWWPDWAPDGKHIVFHSDRDGNFEIYIMAITGEDITRLTDDPAAEYGPAWSPDGTRIAYTSDRSGNREICVKNVDGKGVFNLTNHPANDWSVAWSPGD